MITTGKNANSESVLGESAAEAQSPAAQPHQSSITLDPLSRIALAKLPDHSPELISFASLDDLKRR